MIVTPEGDLNLLALIKLVWHKKIFWILGGALGVLIAALYSSMLPNKYTADVLAAPAGGHSSSFQPSGAVGSLATLAGINFSGGGSDKVALTLETLKSKSFLMGFLSAEPVLVPILAAKGWDSERGTWLFNESVYDSSAQAFKQGYEPSLLRAYHKFVGEHLSVKNNKQSGLITISVTSFSPSASQKWVEMLVKRVNQHMKEFDVAQAKKNLKFLETRLESTEIAEMRAAFYELIEQQIKTIMLAGAQENYALRVIDPPVRPEWPSGPNRKVILALGACLGFVIGLVTLGLIVLRQR